MSEEQFKAFQEAVQADISLQEKLKAVTDPAAIVVIAKDAGFLISVSELQQGATKAELSDEDLDGLAGGGAGATQGVIAGVRRSC